MVGGHAHLGGGVVAGSGVLAACELLGGGGLGPGSAGAAAAFGAFGDDQDVVVAQEGWGAVAVGGAFRRAAGWLGQGDLLGLVDDPADLSTVAGAELLEQDQGGLFGGGAKPRAVLLARLGFSGQVDERHDGAGQDGRHLGSAPAGLVQRTGRSLAYWAVALAGRPGVGVRCLA